MANLFLKIISFYQKTFSPDHGIFHADSFIGCRFYPSCSFYSIQAVEKFGLKKGLPKIIWRIIRCSPLSKGGIDQI